MEVSEIWAPLGLSRIRTQNFAFLDEFMHLIFKKAPSSCVPNLKEKKFLILWLLNFHMNLEVQVILLNMKSKNIGLG